MSLVLVALSVWIFQAAFGDDVERDDSMISPQPRICCPLTAPEIY